MATKNTSMTRIQRLYKTKTGIFLMVVVIGLVIFFISKRGGPTYQFVKVSRGSISETVSLTGNTASVQSVGLSFGNSGTVTRVYTDVGQKVAAGQLLAEL